MMLPPRPLVRRGWAEARQRLRRRIDAWCTCRQCGGRVSPLGDSCGACGAALPGIVPVSPPVLVTALGSMAVLILLRYT